MTSPAARLATARAAANAGYRIERELGAGGMATVYLAEDLKHDRKVAIKVLKPELAAVLGAERFVVEIKTTAALSHPHILPLFDSGTADGFLFYVMPYIEGETIREKLNRETQFGVDEAVRIAREVADALDYAHRHGVIHRDIKPENILLHDGRAMVMDFGIALAVSAAAGGRMTETGLSLGTPHYMSPEQATAEKEITPRSDIYSLATVLYEMLAGEPPHTGGTAQAVIMKIITDVARPMHELRRNVPPHVDAALAMALEKLPADRFETAKAFADALANPSFTSGALMASSSRAPAHRSRQVVAAWAVAAAAGVVAAWSLTGRPDARETLPPSRLSIMVPSGTSFPGGSRLIDISADGSRIAYDASSPNGSMVEVRDLDAATATAVKGTESSTDLHLNPDGRTLYFGDEAGRKMARVNIAGGTPMPLPGVPSAAYLAFASDGTTWYSTLSGTLDQLGADGTVHHRFGGDTLPQPLAMMQVLPTGGGAREALVKVYGSNDGLLYALDLRTGKLTQLLDFPIAEARFVAGYLVFVRNDGRLNAVPFDMKRHMANGAAVQIAADVALSGSGVAQFAVAANGTIAYVPTQPRELVLVDRAGAAKPVLTATRNFHQPRFSPDGKSIVADFTTDEGRDVWLIDRAAGTMTKVTSDGDGHDPSWAPDGKSILYASVKDGAYNIRSTKLGSGTSSLILKDTRLSAWPGRWMPDGKSILTIASDVTAKTAADIALVDSVGKVTTVVATPGTDQWPDISPNGKWLAYSSNQSGQNEVYVRPLHGGDQVQVSLAGGTEAMWSRDGREVFYRTATGAHQVLMSATIQTAPSLAVSSRNTLFDADDYDPAQPHSNYDVSPDGKGFLMVRRGVVSRITVLQNLPGLVARLRGTTDTSR